MHNLAGVFDDVFHRVCKKPFKSKKARLRGLFFTALSCA